MGAVVAEAKDTNIEAQCAAKGMRMTEQRRVIARVLSGASDHPDVEELHRRCAEIDSRISMRASSNATSSGRDVPGMSSCARVTTTTSSICAPGK